MCHIILSMPFLGLSFFWILPIELAFPIYSIILIISGLLYYAVMKSMKAQVTTGSEGMIGEIGNIVECISCEKLVKIHGEIWNAHSFENLKIGEEIKVVNVDGLNLRVISNK